MKGAFLTHKVKKKKKKGKHVQEVIRTGMLRNIVKVGVSIFAV